MFPVIFPLDPSLFPNVKFIYRVSKGGATGKSYHCTVIGDFADVGSDNRVMGKYNTWNWTNGNNPWSKPFPQVI